MSPEPHGLYRATADGAGEEVRDAEIPVHARPDGGGRVAGSVADPGEDVVPEPEDEVEETGNESYLLKKKNGFFSFQKSLGFEKKL